MALVQFRLVITMDDGTTHKVTVRNPDFVRWEETQPRMKWAGPADAPMLWQTFLAWSACKREGLIGDMKWEAFSTAALDVDNLDVSEKDLAAAGKKATGGDFPTVDPTPPEVASG